MDTVTGSENPKDRSGRAKADLSLVPPVAIVYAAQAYMDGARKYGAYNWRSKDVLARVYTAAAMRHILRWQDGEEIDPDSGIHHLGHAIACLGIILDAQSICSLKDDRPHIGAASFAMDVVKNWQLQPVEDPLGR